MRNLIILAILLIGLSSCEDNIKELPGCCEAPALIGHVGLGWFYVPNVFTPNNDGINDYFVIYGSEGMQQIESITIRHESGASVFHARNIPFNDHSGWDGMINGQLDPGIYSYEIFVSAIDGYAKEFSGMICNCPCNRPADADLSIRGCQFGPLDTTVMHGENIEHLPCFEY